MTHQEFVEKLTARHQNLPVVTLLVIDCCARCFRQEAGVSPESIKAYFEHAAEFSLSALETSRLEISRLPTIEALLNMDPLGALPKARITDIVQTRSSIRDLRAA